MKNVILILFLAVINLTACHSQQATQTSQNARAELLSLIPSIFFDVKSTEIKDMAAVERNARWLKANQDKVVVLEGYCDERGSREYNLSLGDRRSRAVMKALMDRGVLENQLIIVSYGKDRPAVKENREEGWAQNRRVEFVLR